MNTSKPQPEIFHVIKDPIHGSMQFTTEENNWIKPFIDSEIFQRLRHIKQLGLTDLIFPGAVHTRFSHNLGCCYIAGQIANKLGLNAADKQIVMIACLLHDIGHGPFSHAFEDIFEKDTITHEMWTPMFLSEYERPEFLKQFNERNPSQPLTTTKIKTIQNLIMHQANNKLFSDIVSSQLDADRLDYLLRDSHFCGVNYGEYDFHWLLHCLTIIQNNHEKRLGITSKGIGVVEHYLMARRLMMKNIYHNGKKYGIEFLLQMFLKHLAKSIAEDKNFAQLGKNPLIEFLKATNQFNQNKIKPGTFIKKNYELYKTLCDYDVTALIRYLAQLDYQHPVISIAKRLHKRKLPKIFHIREKNIKNAKKMIASFKNQQAQDWQIALLTLPHLSYQISQDPILVQDTNNPARSLHDDSLMIHAISDQYESDHLLIVDTEIASESFIKQLLKSCKI